ncbi:MAG: EAL domain-containing protein [Pseudomonadota bacterium]
MKVRLRLLGFFVGSCLVALLLAALTNLAIERYASTSASRALDAHIADAAVRLERSLAGVYGDIANIAASSDGCTGNTGNTLTASVISNPMIAMTAFLGTVGQVACASPQGEVAPFQFLQPLQSMQRPGFSAAPVLLTTNDVRGLLIALRRDEQRIAAFVPLDAIRQALAAYNPLAVASISFLGTVLEDEGTSQADRLAGSAGNGSQLHTIEIEGLEVVIRADPGPAQALFGPLKVWATIGMLGLGALLVLFAGRVIESTPRAVSVIERAMLRGEFVPYYQPTFDVETGRLIGSEMLVRWRKPDGELVSPGAFIDTAERSGLAVPITRMLMQTMALDLGQAYGMRPQLKVAINLFNQHFKSMDIVEEVEQLFGPTPIGFEQLVFEVTERTPLDDLTKAKSVVGGLQALGCRVALDDAGTGHGGLAYLQQLGLDMVKIDKMFIDQIGQGGAGESIAHTLTDLAGQLGMAIVAEGVESAEQLAHLRRAGIREAQGFLFAPALPASRYLKLIETLLPLADRAEMEASVKSGRVAHADAA